MNNSILNIEIQEYIRNNINSNISDLLLKGVPFNDIDPKVIIEQLEAKQRSKKKLPTWFETENIYYSNKLNIEQTSSEITANYKANLAHGKSLIDLTGGFGIDTFYFSKRLEHVTHCEINTELSNIAKHNFEVLEATNIECLNTNGIDALKQTDKPFDWIYVDPSRRDDNKRKVFLLSDCTPNVKTFQGLFLKYAKRVMVKTSPLLDIKATLKDLKFVKELHVIAVNNEVKELLWILERDFENTVSVKTINIQKEKTQTFEYNIKEEQLTEAELREPLAYLYEPNVAILKAGAFNVISTKLKLQKLHKHSHLYTSKELIEFPGRRFKIVKELPFNKKAFTKENISKANVATRNFPLSVSDIRKKLKLKDGGNTYLFFTTDKRHSKVILVCAKA
ncbi:class I SAM-dependent methyltransferase [Winogradskyella flava]|uniref:Class I SAM-dependent methyltransferase n=1 Tax=Winogradskyella flava TaxID=1884876 RepID=A0A842IVA5_9FLAO|nr:class I SAM-dependent methyltransferase [Winogradskyella flava]MBC2845277.1 class I SAM-dependent methyltransferase [Winogradskyella flava]